MITVYLHVFMTFYLHLFVITVYLHVFIIFYLHVFMIIDNEPFYSLTSALKKIFFHSELNYHHCLLTVSPPDTRGNSLANGLAR